MLSIMHLPRSDLDVAGVAVDQTAARDDYDRRLIRQSLSLLNRISRRVSASRYPG